MQELRNDSLALSKESLSVTEENKIMAEEVKDVSLLEIQPICLFFLNLLIYLGRLHTTCQAKTKSCGQTKFSRSCYPFNRLIPNHEKADGEKKNAKVKDNARQKR
jgi:hypothetical protein